MEDSQVQGFGFKILMFPWLAYGHISPFLELSTKLASRGFQMFLCSTPINLSFIKRKITTKNSDSVELIELHLPNTPELPPHYHTTNGLPLHLNSALKSAVKSAKSDILDILKRLNPDLVIYDGTFAGLPSIPGLFAANNVPAVKFSASPAVFGSYMWHMFTKPGIPYPFPAIFMSEFQLEKIRSMAESAAAEARAENPEEIPKGVLDKFTLIRSCREIEGKYFDFLTNSFGSEIIPVGPLFRDPHPILGKDDDNGQTRELFDWLGEKSELSTVFVSFGTEYFLEKQEIEEIALGLELSNVNFIWVIRYPIGDETKLKSALPDGFEERVKERGKILEGWAPQAKILESRSIAGFVCHCGWSSILESIQFCVPIIAMPMQIDQPLNARLAVDIGVGIEVMRKESGRFEGETIANVIEDVVVGTAGENLRERMKVVRENMKVEEKHDLDELVRVITQFCGAK